MKKKHESELTLEDWELECKKMDEETAQSNAEIRQMMAEIRSDHEMDPDVRRVMLETGEKILGMDDWVKEFNAKTSEIIAQCDAFVAKADALEKKAKSKCKKGCVK